MPRKRIARTVAAALLAAPLVAQAQYAADFEAPVFSASMAGIPLAGQDGFYLPTGAIGGRCYVYDGNALGIAPNPLGGAQFVACTRAVSDYARAQHDVNWGQGEACWIFELDLNLHFVGELPTLNYAGSVSLQPFPGDGAIILLFKWDDVSAADRFTVNVLGHAADGHTPYVGGLPIGHAAFQGLDANTWYRLGLRVEFTLNALTAISIRDISNGGATTGFIPLNLDGYYLGGGAAAGDRPAAVRIFGGGGFETDHVAGNTLAVDNLRLLAAGARDCLGDIDFNQQVDIQDLAFLLNSFGIAAGATYSDGDLDCDGDVDLDDLAVMLANFGTFC